MAFADMDRADDALGLVTTVLYKDVPSFYKIRQDIFPETVSAKKCGRALQTRLGER